MTEQTAGYRAAYPDDIINRATDEVARLMARARYGPGVDMGGKHNPLPSERHEAALFVQHFIAPLVAERDAAHDARIEAQNPGIDMDEVRRHRAAQSDRSSNA